MLVLHLPDSEAQFVVEVDASHVGVGAILFQQAAVDQKILLCIFLLGNLNE